MTRNNNTKTTRSKSKNASIAVNGVDPLIPETQSQPFTRQQSREDIKEVILGKDPTRDYQSTKFSYYGEIFVQDLPQWRLWTGRMMLTSDPIVNFSLNVRNAALGAAEVIVTAKNPQVKQWVEEQWSYLWNQHRTKLVSAKKWGFAPLQMLFKQKNGLLCIKGVKDFAPEDCRALESGGRLVGQRVKGKKLFFPQACWLTFGAEFGSPYGTGTLRRSYPAWYEKWMDHGAKRLLQLRMIKDAYIGDVFWYPPNMNVQLPDGTVLSWRDMLREIGENRLSGGAMTLPRLYDNGGKELTGYTPPQDVGGGSQLFEWTDVCDEGIMRGADVPMEVVKASDTGSGYSGRSIPFLVVLSVCTQELVEIIQRVDEQVFRPLAWLNWGGDPDYQIIPRSLVESFSNDTSGSAMGGSTLGQPAGGAPGPQQMPPGQGQQQFSEGEMWETNGVERHPHLSDSPHGMVHIDKLKPTHGRNQRPAKPIDHKAPYKPIVIDHHGEIQDGHHRYYHLKDKGYKGHVPVVVYGGGNHNKLGLKHVDTVSQHAEQFAESPLDYVHTRHRGVTIKLDHSKPGVSNIDYIGVAKEHRGKGRAHEAMKDLTKTADMHGVTLRLTPDGQYGSSVKRLRKFYAKHGFKSRGMPSGSMERAPTTQHSEEEHPHFSREAMESARQQEGYKSRSKLLHMHPKHFLDMAASTEEVPHKKAGVEKVLESGSKFHDVPHLTFEHDGKGHATVVGHEGRHRAMALVRRGVTSMPVLLHSSSSNKGPAIRWDQQHEGSFDKLKDEQWPKHLHGQDRLEGKPHKTIPFPVSRSTQHSEQGDAPCAPFRVTAWQFDESEALKKLREFIQKGTSAKIKTALEQIRALKRTALDPQSLSGQIQREVLELRPLILADLTAGMWAGTINGMAETVEALPPAVVEAATPTATPTAPPTVAEVVGEGASTEHIVLPALEDSLATLAKSPAMAGANYQQTAELVRQGAFAITANITDHAVEEVKTAVADAMREGQGLAEFVDNVADKLGEGVLSESHLENVYRTNILAAKSAAQERALAHPIVGDAFPYVVYFSTQDGRRRAEHKYMEEHGLDGTNYYRADDPVFKMFRPPWDYQCRCRWYPQTVEQAARAGVKEAQEWLERAKKMAEERKGTFYEYLSATQPLQLAFVTPPPFLPPPTFQRIV